MENEKLIQIYEGVRSILLNSESISEQISKLTHTQLKERLIELNRTAQSDLLILTDFLIELMNCETESDLDFLLELTSDGLGG